MHLVSHATLCTYILQTCKVYSVQVNMMKKEIRDVEEGMEKVMKKFTGEMHSLNKIMVPCGCCL